MQQPNGHAAADALTSAPALQHTASQPPAQRQSNSAPWAGFHKAIKSGAKARVALVGVSGSGKSFTGLVLARELAGPNGKIAAIDTEHGSLSKYADLFDFDVDEPESYTTEYLLEQLTFAEENSYDVFMVDSLSHFWMGKDGALEFVDSVKKRTRDQMEGWKNFAPHERRMVDRFLASTCHVIVTMRVKTDYEEVVDERGKKKRVKVGLAPVQRQGLEYEFDMVCSMDDENNLLIDKTRCPIYSQEHNRTAARPTAAYFQSFIHWLAGPAAIRTPRSAPVAIEPVIDTGGHPVGTQAAADYVAQQKIQAGNPACAKPWTTRGEAKRIFETLRERVGEFAYLATLESFGAKSAEQLFRSPDQALQCYYRLMELAVKEIV